MCGSWSWAAGLLVIKSNGMLLLVGAMTAPLRSGHATRRFPAANLGSPTHIVMPGETGQQPTRICQTGHRVLQEISFTGQEVVNSKYKAGLAT